MHEIVGKSLEKISKGAAIVLIGTAIGTALAFATRVIIVRYVSQNEYGIYCSVINLVNIVATLSILGLETGVPRQIAFYQAKNDIPKVEGIVSAAIKISIISGLLFCLFLFVASDFIAIRFFHDQEFADPLKIASAAIPFFVMIISLTAIFRGFGRVQPNLYFRQILMNILFILTLIIIIIFNLSFLGVLYSFVISTAISFIAYIIYAISKTPLSLTREVGVAECPLIKDLLLFSLPLFAAGLFDSIPAWSDTLLLGYFMTPNDVALYNAASPLAHFLPVAMVASGFLYLPLMAQLYAKGQKEEIKRSYAVLTKWIFAFVFPIFLIFMLFPEATLNMFFGSSYIGAASVLQILSIGFFINAISGPNGITLVIMGNTRFVLLASLTATITSIALGIILIPPLGIIGAASATASSLLVRNIMVSAKIYTQDGIHPFTKNYLKPIITSSVIVIFIYLLVTNLVTVISWWMLPVLFVLFSVAYGISLLLTRSFDNEDIKILLTVEQTLGLNLTEIKKMLRRFI